MLTCRNQAGILLRFNSSEYYYGLVRFYELFISISSNLKLAISFRIIRGQIVCYINYKLWDSETLIYFFIINQSMLLKLER